MPTVAIVVRPPAPPAADKVTQSERAQLLLNRFQATREPYSSFTQAVVQTERFIQPDRVVASTATLRNTIF